MEFSFNLYNSLAASGVHLSLKRLLGDRQGVNLPVVVCVGSDLSVGDSLGPVVGTMLVKKMHGISAYVYGTLARPITAHEVKYTGEFIKSTHPECPVIAIDAAVGAAGDIGLVKVNSKALSPGSGANKRLNRLGDVSIMGIVAEKSLFNYSLFSSTRLNIVYKMAEIISEGVASYIASAAQAQALNAGAQAAIG